MKLRELFYTKLIQQINEIVQEINPDCEFVPLDKDAIIEIAINGMFVDDELADKSNDTI